MIFKNTLIPPRTKLTADDLDQESRSNQLAHTTGSSREDERETQALAFPVSVTSVPEATITADPSKVLREEAQRDEVATQGISTALSRENIDNKESAISGINGVIEDQSSEGIIVRGLSTGEGKFSNVLSAVQEVISSEEEDYFMKLII